MPAICSALRRSPSTVRASSTVLAGYKEDNVTTMLNGPYRDRHEIQQVGEHVENAACDRDGGNIRPACAAIAV